MSCLHQGVSGDSFYRDNVLRKEENELIICWVRLSRPVPPGGCELCQNLCSKCFHIKSILRRYYEYQFVFSWIMFKVSGASAGSIAAVAILIDDIDIGDIIAEVGMNYDSELQELLPVISSICVSRPEEGHLAHFPPHLISTNICLTVCSTISRKMFTKL